MSNAWGLILERIKARTSTPEDLEALGHLLNGLMIQEVSQSGKYNLNAGHAIFNVGDMYGPSIEDIRIIIKELRENQQQCDLVGLNQSTSTSEDEPLTVLNFQSEIIEFINSRLEALEELRKAGYLFDEQKNDLKSIKTRVNFLKEITHQIEDIAVNADQVLQDAIRILTTKLRELDSYQEASLLEARSQICLKQQLDLLEQLQKDLGDGKVLAYWLDSQIYQNFAEMIGQYSLEKYALVKASQKELEVFYLTVKHFLEQLIRCLKAGRTNSLDNLTIPLIFSADVYITAFEYLKTLIPNHLPNGGVEQLVEYTDYLITKIPSCQHISID